MHQVTALPLASYSFGSRFSEAGPAASLCANLHRWRRRASLEAIARAFSDLSFNPFLFQIESDR